MRVRVSIVNHNYETIRQEVFNVQTTEWIGMVAFIPTHWNDIQMAEHRVYVELLSDLQEVQEKETPQV